MTERLCQDIHRAVSVDRSMCQASFDWHFVREISVREDGPQRAIASTTLRIGVDPYVERSLGHCSSGLLMEISKQIAKSTFQAVWPIDGAVRYMVHDLTMTFPNYTLLDASLELALRCTVELKTSKRERNRGTARVEFRQGNAVTAIIVFTTTVLTPTFEQALERRTRTAIGSTATAVGDCAPSADSHP